MQKILILFILPVFLFSCIENEIKTRPNILIIISDDQGYGDFGFTGNKLADTPLLDERVHSIPASFVDVKADRVEKCWIK